MSRTLSQALNGWIPYNLKLRNNQYSCEWLYTDQTEYTDPFFAETISRCKSHPYNSNSNRSLSSLSALTDWAADINEAEPSAFIFHVSRCGSTLISQALGIDEAHIVLSEVPFIDEVLRLSDSDQWPEELDRDSIIKAAFNFYGQNRNGKKKWLFVKTDCWHIYFLPLLRKLYPATPFILLYRRPDEVLRSQKKKRGMQAIPGLVEDHILGISPGSVTNLDGHMANILESFLASFKNIILEDKLAMLVNYNEGIEVIVKRIAAFTGMKLNENDLEQIRLRSRFNAKYPDQVFSEEAIDETVPAYLEKAFTHYSELEKIRKCGSNA